jgi:hypothetical protein
MAVSGWPLNRCERFLLRAAVALAALLIAARIVTMLLVTMLHHSR